MAALLRFGLALIVNASTSKEQNPTAERFHNSLSDRGRVEEGLIQKLLMADEENKIKLEQFLKLVGIVGTGGQAKLLIQAGEVKVNGQVETRRGRKLTNGDRVYTMGETFKVDLPDLPA